MSFSLHLVIGMKNPQWASVSFGTVFCLECSGVHRYENSDVASSVETINTNSCSCLLFRAIKISLVCYFDSFSIIISSLGVHVTFVRSIAMDSWTDTQLALMKCGGNAKCASFLKEHGVDLNASIREKYESPAAQLYKQVLKARAEGRPEPTQLPPQRASAPSSGNRMAVGKPGEDVNGMERLTGETEQQYIARQTRLREEARARMAAKFGSGGGMGGVGSGGRTMSGIGSDSSYDPSRGGYGGGYGADSLNVDSLVYGMGAAFSTLGSITRTAAQSASAIVSDPSTQQSLQGITGSVKSTGSSLWNTLSTSVNSAVQTISMPDDGGLSEFNREMHSHRSASGSQYAGFGSDSINGSGGGTSFGAAPTSGSSSTLEEAPGLPGEDRNGIERLSGESDEQYVMRQTRLRDEAKARMAAKFGGGGMSSASSNSYAGTSSMPASRIPSAPSSNGSAHRSAPSSAPTSANLTPNRIPVKATKVPVKMDNSDDFFASFGT
jgi:ADP-ribosylation factor GTPase-activating protein 1